MRARALLVLLGLVAAGCNDFEPASLLRGLRVLGVRAEPPELAPGETTTLEVLWHDADGGPPPTLRWAYCTLAAVPGTGQGVNQQCLDADEAPFLVQLGEGPTMQVTMPQVTPADLGLPDATFGFYLPVRVLVQKGDTPPIKTIYRLRLATTPARNTNPRLITVLPFAGATTPVEVSPGQRVFLSAVVDESRIDTYLRLTGDPRDMMLESVTELPRVSWYATAGDFTEQTTGLDLPLTELDLTAKFAPVPGQVIDVYAVLRDERGGIDWQHGRIRLTP